MPTLAPGARIAVVASSHAFFEGPYEQGVAWLQEQGWQVVEPQGLRARHRYFAGDDDHRLAQLVAAFQRDDVDAVWAVRGGSGLTRLLPRMPWKDLRLDRPYLGFSDATPLLDQLRRRGGVAVHAPVVHSLGATDADSLDHLQRLLAGQPLGTLAGRTLVPGIASGPVVGGNLCMVAATCGTPFQLDATGCLLVLEEIGETPYKVDRMLQQLQSAGVFRGVAGVALGTFTGCAPPDGADWSLDDVRMEHLEPLGVPVVADLPIGHGPANRAFVVGGLGQLDGNGLTLGYPVV